MNAKIIRDEQSRDGALGKLYSDDVYFCETLQPDKDEITRFYIPAGDYVCKRFHGTKWKNTFEIVCPPHIALLFHAGNTEADTLGCVLLGSERGKLKGNRAILNSGATFQKFLELTKDIDEFALTIEDKYAE